MRSASFVSLKVLLIALLMFGLLITVSVGIVHAQDSGDGGTPVPEAPPPEIDDPPSDAELQDL